MSTFTPSALVESWRSRRPLSEHLRLELAHAVRTGHEPGDPPPLEDAAPVPGCGCSRCTGMASATPEGKLRRARRLRDGPLPVERARAVFILEVARRLGLGEPKRCGRGEYVVACPFHDDHDPSLTLTEGAGLFYCFPCGVGGDSIELVRRVRRVSFTSAVRWIAGEVAS